MAQARAAKLAQAVLDDLNAQSFSQPFTAQRRRIPTQRLRELKNLNVWVIAQQVEVIPETRSKNREQYTIQVAVARQVDPENNAAIDDLEFLLEEIVDYLDRTSYDLSGLRAVHRGARTHPLGRPDEPSTLREDHVYLGVAQIDYYVWL